jgi:hypothetical protein
LANSKKIENNVQGKYFINLLSDVFRFGEF